MRAFITHASGLWWWEEQLARVWGDRDLLCDLLELGLRVSWALRGWDV